MRQELKIAKMADWVDKGKTPQRIFDRFQLKTMQKAILNCLQVSDVIANLPTGFGKSLLFQYPASLQTPNQKCVLVIVPLKALLWDCIRQAQELGITAEQIDYHVINAYYKNDKLPQILVATPQKIFATQNTMNFLESLHSLKKIRLLVIDECHCISQWGHDFRPAYLQLQKLRQLLSGVRLLAISATITPQSRVDLTQRMFLYTAHYFQASYHRHNLYYGILKCKAKSQIEDRVVNFLKQKNLLKEQGIIYCQTINSAEQLSQKLSSQINCGLFHSKLSEKRRKEVYDDFTGGKIKAIVGTICFGMGINKKDIRYVVNIGISKSPQNYYQESGRAGRDGLPAYCMIVSFSNQTNSYKFLIGQSNMTKKQKAHQLIKLEQINEYALQDFECRRKNLFRKLGQNFNPENCNKTCDRCQQQDKGIVKKKLDYFTSVKKIIEQLQIQKPYFTKKQLISYLKGKNINKTKKGKSQNISFGQNIHGIFSKQKPQIIEKIVEGMISQNLLVQEIRPKSKYFVQYYKPANKSSTKSFKQFFIFVQSEPETGPEQDKNAKIGNKFDKFLKKKGVQGNQKPKQVKSLGQLTQGKFHQNQLLIQADVVKQKQNYQSFFSELFGDDILGDLQKRESHILIDSQDENHDQIIMNEQIEQEPQYLEQKNSYEDESKILDDYIISRLNQQKAKKKQKQSLKRHSLNDQKINNNQN